MILGETYTDRVTIADTDGVPASAGTVTAVVTLPAGTTANATVTESEQGQYDIDYLTTAVGRHEVLVTATGGVLGSVVRELFRGFYVDSAGASAWLVFLPDVKAFLNIPATVTSDDDELSDVIGVASGLVEAESQLWHRATVVEQYDPARRLYLRSRPVQSITSVVQAGVTFGATTYELTPIGDALRAASGSGCPPWSGTGKVTVTYVAGETVNVPRGVRQATLLTIEAIWAAQRGASGLPIGGRSGYEDDDAVPDTAYALPYGAMKLLEPWARGPLMA